MQLCHPPLNNFNQRTQHRFQFDGAGAAGYSLHARLTNTHTPRVGARTSNPQRPWSNYLFINLPSKQHRKHPRGTVKSHYIARVLECERKSPGGNTSQNPLNGLYNGLHQRGRFSSTSCERKTSTRKIYGEQHFPLIGVCKIPRLRPLSHRAGEKVRTPSCLPIFASCMLC